MGDEVEVEHDGEEEVQYEGQGLCLFFLMSVLLLLALKKIPITEHKTTHT